MVCSSVWKETSRFAKPEASLNGFQRGVTVIHDELVVRTGIERTQEQVPDRVKEHHRISGED